MKRTKSITYHSATAVNVIIFVLFATVFIMVFFCPEQAGIIAGKITAGFYNGLKIMK